MDVAGATRDDVVDGRGDVIAGEETDLTCRSIFCPHDGPSYTLFTELFVFHLSPSKHSFHSHVSITLLSSFSVEGFAHQPQPLQIDPQRGACHGTMAIQRRFLYYPCGGSLIFPPPSPSTDRQSGRSRQVSTSLPVHTSRGRCMGGAYSDPTRSVLNWHHLYRPLPFEAF